MPGALTSLRDAALGDYPRKRRSVELELAGRSPQGEEILGVHLE
jgi:hypothetical protein